jgi:tetratricopeptide (TPR) repeat protein
MGDIARERGDVAGAIAWYRKATSVRPYAEAETTLAAVLAAQGQSEEAEAHYRRALATDPRNAFAYTSYGVLLGDRGRRDEAIAMHQRAIEIEPGLAEAWTNLGSTFDDLGNAAEARRAYDRALSLRPSPEAYNNLGVLDLKGNRPTEAAARFRQALALRPGVAAIHENLGLALRAAGDAAGAASAFESALRLDPTLPTSRAALEQLRTTR